VLPALGESGGVERGTVEVAKALHADGWRALVASAGGRRMEDLSQVAEHRALPLDRRDPWTISANIGRLARLIRDEGVDIVHARSRAPAWSAFHAARRTGRPFVTTFHGTYSAGWAGKRAYNRIMTRGDRVIAISAFIAEHIRRRYGIDEERLRVIPRGVDLAHFDPGRIETARWAALLEAWALNDGWPVVLLPGRLTRWKGQTVLIEAMARLGRDGVHCVLVGDDQGRESYRLELQRLVRRRGLGDSVRMVGVCRDMPAAYFLADVVVSASTEPEAFGRVALEAQAMGRPVIATDHGGATETVRPGETGWLVPPGDPDALAAALAEALALDAAARARMAATATAHVRETFTLERMTEATIGVYRELL